PIGTISDLSPSLSADDLTMWFTSSRSGNWEIYSTTRSAVGQPFGPEVLETVVSDPNAVESDVFVTHDGLEMWFGSSRGGTQGGLDLMVSTRSSTTAPWAAPIFAPGVNSPDSDASPSLTADGLTLYFLSSRIGSPAP